MSRELIVELGDHRYPIKIEKGSLDRLGELLLAQLPDTAGKKTWILTDDQVGNFYLERAMVSLDAAGYEVYTMVLPHGEDSKAFSVLPRLYQSMLESKLNRKDLVITLGGGVIGDIGGFAASTYLRGIPFIQVPTSLLAQVDSSVGGKVAADLPEGKNLVGSFYQPKAVIIDPELLQTLPDKFYRDGMAEVIKYGCILDRKFFELLAGLSSREEVMVQIEDIIAQCCTLKKDVVEKDERDTGERMLLNFGHTLGHAIETFYHFAGPSHGESVAIGMYQICSISEKAGLTIKGTAGRIRDILVQYGLPYEINEVSNSALLGTIDLDKKNLGSKLNVVLLKEIGTSYLYQTTSAFFNQ